MSDDLSKRPMVGLGDLIRAAVCLDASREQCGEIAALLDLSRVALTQPPSSRGTPRASTKADAKDLKLPIDSLQGEQREQGRAFGARFDANDTRGFDLFGPIKSTRVESFLLEGVPPLGPLTTSSAPSLPHQPLFHPLSARNILATTLSIEEEAGQIDVERFIDDIASCRAVTRLPREPSPTLRRGAFVLVDHSDAMEPFQGDVAEVMASIERVLGTDKMACFTFDGSPKALSRWDDGEPWRFEAPVGTPVLFISDLGLRRPSAENDWEEFTAVALRAGCVLTALVPYPPSRWPAPLARRMRVVTWDRATTVAAAWRATRRSGMRP